MTQHQQQTASSIWAGGLLLATSSASNS